MMGIAQTGTGKTIAYLLPCLKQWKFSKDKAPQILIIVPTRELVIQVVEEIKKLTTYMNVIVVGINTYGKYTGSFTVRDWDQNGVVNPNHKYAMQPITLKVANSKGVSDFVDGLAPTIRAEEDVVHLLPFGDPNETLLAICLADIKGIPVTSIAMKSARFRSEKVADSHIFKPFAHEMYINPKLKHQE